MERLKQLRKEKGFTQQQVADSLGLQRELYVRYENGSRRPPIDNLVALADYFDVSMDDLVGREWDDHTMPFGLSPLPEMQSVPLIGDIACGTPITAEENLDGYVNVPVDVVCHFALRCKGDSMAPRVQEGDLVYIRQQPDVEEGQIAAVLIDNEVTLKHVYHIPNGVSLVAENPTYPPIIYTGDACNEIWILGLAVAYQRMLV